MKPPTVEESPPGRAGAWAYDPSSSRRDLRLDLLRGLCLAKMVFNHLWDSPVHDVQEWMIGYVSAAEGFFFISGAVVGIVYGRRAEELGLGEAGRQVLRRASHLYLANLALVFLLLSLEVAGYLPWTRFTRGGELAVHQVFLLDQPYFLHVLPRYVVFLAATPLALWCLVRGRTAWLLGASFALWAWNLAPWTSPHIPFLEGESPHFPTVSWQLLFFVGIACGHHRARLAALWRRVSRRRWLLAALAAAALAFALLRIGHHTGHPLLDPRLLSTLFGRQALGPLRLVNLVVVFALLYGLTDHYWKRIEGNLGRALLPLGANALYVFLLHIPLVFLGGWLLTAQLPELEQPSWIFLPLDLALVALLWLAARRRFLFGIVPR